MANWKELNQKIANKSATQSLHPDRWVGCGHYPNRLKATADMICNAYDIKGLADPAYIANVIALQLGIGDGNGNFFKTSWVTEKP